MFKVVSLHYYPVANGTAGNFSIYDMETQNLQLRYNNTSSNFTAEYPYPETKSRSVYVVYNTTQNWTLQWNCSEVYVRPPCLSPNASGSVFSAPNGTLLSDADGFGPLKQYANNERCNWTIQCPEGYGSVSVTVSTHLPTGDALEIKTGSPQEHGVVLQRLQTRLESLTTTFGRSKLFINFTSDSQLEFYGWSLSYQCMAQPIPGPESPGVGPPAPEPQPGVNRTQCSAVTPPGPLAGRHGVLLSDADGDARGTKTSPAACAWTLPCDGQSHARITFTGILEDHDTLTVGNNTALSGLRSTGSEFIVPTPTSITYSSNVTAVNLTSGYYLQYRCLDSRCLSPSVADRATLPARGRITIPSTYTPGEGCQWTLACPAAYVGINVTITGSLAPHDTFVVHVPGSTVSPLLNYTGGPAAVSSVTFEAAQQSVVLRFASSPQPRRAAPASSITGLTISYTCLTFVNLPPSSDVGGNGTNSSSAPVCTAPNATSTSQNRRGFFDSTWTANELCEFTLTCQNTSTNGSMFITAVSSSAAARLAIRNGENDVAFAGTVRDTVTIKGNSSTAMLRVTLADTGSLGFSYTCLATDVSSAISEPPLQTSSSASLLLGSSALPSNSGPSSRILSCSENGAEVQITRVAGSIPAGSSLVITDTSATSGSGVFNYTGNVSTVPPIQAEFVIVEFVSPAGDSNAIGVTVDYECVLTPAVLAARGGAPPASSDSGPSSGAFTAVAVVMAVALAGASGLAGFTVFNLLRAKRNRVQNMDETKTTPVVVG